jgi:nucleotide-binding universal stress UspA family protein
VDARRPVGQDASHNEAEAAVHTIVVGYEEGEAGRLALERAAELARAFGASVVVTSVLRTIATDAAIAGAAGLSPLIMDPEPTERERADWERQLEEARSYLEGRGIVAEIAATIGEPVDEILEVARLRDADLIVVGTHEPGVLRRLFRGSVSDGIVHKAHCDVLVVHPEQVSRAPEA